LAKLNKVTKGTIEPGRAYYIPYLIYEQNGMDRLDKYLEGDPGFSSNATLK